MESFAIITTAAAPQLVDIHDRQPAIIESSRFDDWLDPASPVPQLLELVREPRAVHFGEARGQQQDHIATRSCLRARSSRSRLLTCVAN